MNEFENPEDFFETEQFKSLSKWQRFKIRIKVAFFQSISYF
jgi:hypothetical protein